MSKRVNINAGHSSPRNGSDAIDPQEFDAPIRNKDDIANPNAHIDLKMIHPEFEVVSVIDAARKKKLENLMFDQEMVTVDILDTEDENADVDFVIQVSGQSQIFTRGTRVTVKRMFIEGLAGAKPISYSPVRSQDGEIRSMDYKARRGERYAFSVYHDPNPIGREWLRQVRARA